MNAAEEHYAEAMQETHIARKYATNAEYWRIVLETLYEEDPKNYLPGELRKKEKDIIRRLNRNLKMAEKTQRHAEKTMRRSNKLRRKDRKDAGWA